MDREQAMGIQGVLDDLSSSPLKALPAHAILIRPVYEVLEALLDAAVLEVALALARETEWPPFEGTPSILDILDCAVGAMGIRGGVSHENVWCVLREELQGVTLEEVLSDLQIVVDEMAPRDAYPLEPCEEEPY